MNDYFKNKLEHHQLTDEQRKFYELGATDFGNGIINYLSNITSAVHVIDYKIEHYKKCEISDVVLLRELQKNLISILTDTKLIANIHYGKKENYYN